MKETTTSSQTAASAEHELMSSMKISKAVAKMAIPSVISSLVTVVYNIADTFFAIIFVSKD